jgi:hypothetical protein
LSDLPSAMMLSKRCSSVGYREQFCYFVAWALVNQMCFCPED